jgi:hypothetical protein
MECLHNLIFSSHKTGTQTLLNMFATNKIYSSHCHKLKDLDNHHNLPILFINKLINYKKINNKKLKIITIIRNPIDRLISSFFQTYNDDEIYFFNVRFITLFNFGEYIPIRF